MQSPKTYTHDEIKALRVEIDALIQKLDLGGSQEMDSKLNFGLYYMSENESLKSLILAKMWLGKCLEALGSPFPAELADKANI